MQKIIVAIKNFLSPNAQDNLKLLNNYIVEENTNDDSMNGYKDGYYKQPILDAFEECDLESLKWIISNNLLHPAMLCKILARLFECAGKLAYSHRDDYETKQKEGFTTCINHWKILADDNIDFLLNYLCNTHSALAKNWRQTLIYKNNTNNSRFEKKNRYFITLCILWIRN